MKTRKLKNILTMEVKYEHDTVIARQRARYIAGLLGFGQQDQTRISTAVSEIVRNVFTYAGGGKVEYCVEDATPKQAYTMRISDHGPGIADVRAILEGRFKSKTGMGLGITGARRLVDFFDIQSSPGKGTTVLLKKLLPAGSQTITGKELAHIADELARLTPQSAYEEIQQQNQELLRAMEEVHKRHEELVSLNNELDETNRGVLALYSEIDEKNQRLKQAYELKSQFLSNMSHELRTPINSILALSRLLLDKADGPLTVEQEKQLVFIGKATHDLSELVNDLLDLAKLAARKVIVRPEEFEITNLFNVLRGLFRPLKISPSVDLIFEEPRDLPLLHTDEGKVSQILRNFISNALKFTERGEVRVSAVLAPDGEAVVFSVADTGIGIPLKEQANIFEEFSQIENPMQRHVRGTGLGLALSKGLAEMLGGEISLKSEPGAGSTFSAAIPIIYSEHHEATVIHETPFHMDTALFPVLVIEDDPATFLLYDKYLKGSDFQLIPARNLDEARRVLKRLKPAAIVLDIMLPRGNGWDFLAEMKGQESTWDIPIIVATILDEKERGMTLGADDYCVKPVERKWLLHKLKYMAKSRPVKKILVIDDNEVDRYLIKSYLAQTPHKTIEAANGTEGLQKAVMERPNVILLDLIMPEMDGFEVLERLKSNPDVCDIPVIIITSKVLDEEEKKQLSARSLAILSKNVISREELLRRIKDALIKTKIEMTRV